MYSVWLRRNAIVLHICIYTHSYEYTPSLISSCSKEKNGEFFSGANNHMVEWI